VRDNMDKEWEVEATIEIRTSIFCDTKEEAEKEAHKYLTELCQGLYPECCSNSYEIENIYSYSED
jgi:hypothetical protein